MSVYAWGNVVTAAVVCAAVVFVLRARRNRYWREAWGRIVRNKPAAVSLAVLAVYVTVGLLDCVAWRDPVRDESGAVVKGEDGRPVYEPVGYSLLDRLLWKLRTSTEKTYSAPLARCLYDAEISRDESGRVRLVRPPLRHPRIHLLGTDKIGEDVLYKSLKSIRTALIIGGFTTLIAVPFALLFGVLAGYFGGWVDDLIQYLYTVVACIPGVLLIMAFMLMFDRGLFQLCVILGITSWTGLCRLVRGETLKLRELDYVQASRAAGAGHAHVILRHVVPNLMHIVLISSILRFSGLVLAEAVLTYIGVGVGADVYSWGNMINEGRFELAREPAVWWNLAASFVFMFGLVLSANVFGDAVRDALDPRLRSEAVQ